MTLEIIGLLTVVAGVLILAKGPNLGAYFIMFATLLGAAAAVKLPALGGASVTPAHALLPFYCVAVLRLPGGLRGILDCLRYPRAGFWLAVFVVYGSVTAAFLPRMFAGTTNVFAIAPFTASGRMGIIVTWLAPTTSNITQTVYLLGNLAFFAALSKHMLSGGRQHVIAAILCAAIANLCFALLDMVTYATDTAAALGFIRNANYSILAENSIGGFKRIVGSFPEASAFGGITTIFFVFCCELWLRGRGRPTTAIIAFISLIFLILSTSTSTYIALGAYCGLLVARCGFALLRGAATRRQTSITIAGPAVLLLTLTGLALIPGIWAAFTDLVNATLVNKLASQSAIERTGWNGQGMQTFLDTYMLGAGVGSVRTSSFVVALLANVGVIGTLLFAAFLTALYTPSRVGARNRDPTVDASLWACATALLLAGVAGTSVDMGLVFFSLAAVGATARLARSDRGSSEFTSIVESAGRGSSHAAKALPVTS